MTLSPFFISALFLCVPYALASQQDIQNRTVSLRTWGWTLPAIPFSLAGWYKWYFSGTFDPRIFLLLVGFIASYFIAQYLYKTGHPEIGGGDLLGICIMLLYVPILPELGNIIYIFPLCICTLLICLYWNTRKGGIPFLFPFTVSHIGLLVISTFIYYGMIVNQ